jgi:outer membrane protein assembly factor BamB
MMASVIQCRQLLLSLVTSFAVITPIVANDWPEFRGPTRDGISTATNVPTQWNTTENVAWQTEIPGKGWSSPTLVGGRIYLTTATGEEDNLSLRAICIDATAGNILWDVELFQPSSEIAGQKHGKNGLASPSPIVADGRVYAHFGHMGSAALDLEGNILWQQTGIQYDPQHGCGGSPVLIDGVLVFSCDGLDTQHIVGLDALTGDIRWKTPRNTAAIKTFSISTPQTINIDGQSQVVSPGSGFVGSYDPADGRELWRVDYGEGFSVIPRPVYALGRLYLATGFGRTLLLAIDPHGASGNATESHLTWQHSKSAPNTPSVIVVGEEIYFVSDNGVASCLDAHSGEVHWTKRLGGNYSASPIAAEGRLYFTNEDGVTRVISAAIEYELLETNDLEDRTFASLTPDNGKLYIRTESKLWCIGQD